jgi:gamma-glutamylcyclotransferase (GGCT)/AIG2-like uncharacterized protein YtfP
MNTDLSLATNLLFVYGTLRRNCPSGAHQKYLAGAEFVANAQVRGSLYRVSYYPALAVDGKGWVQGEIYRLKDKHQLALLDTYEECTYPALPEQEYQRCLIQAESFTGECFTVWVYAYQHPLDNLPLIASGDFLNP